MKKTALFGMFIGIAGLLSAQETPKFAWDIGAGFTTPVNDTGNNTDTGWNVRGGAGYNFTRNIGVLLNAGFDDMGINSATLSDLGFGGGSLHIFSLTLDPTVRFHFHKLGFYATGGGGYFRENFDFSDAGFIPTVSQPIFGFPPANTPTLTGFGYSINKPGLEGGLGVTFGSKWHGQFFAEARYVQIWSGSFHTNYVPVTFGFRR